MMSLRGTVTFVAGTVGGLAASALALQATGTWRPTETQLAAVIAVAAATASVATIRGAVDRFRTDIRWRRWRFVAVSIAIALASVAATALLALVAGQVLRLGTATRGVLIVVAAACAFGGTILGAYGDERFLGDQNRQKQLEGVTSLLLVQAAGVIQISPRDLAVVLFLTGRKKFRPGHAALRIVHTDSIGGVHEHPSVIYEAKQNAHGGGIVNQIWQCYGGEEDVTNIEPAAVRPIQIKTVLPSISTISELNYTGPGVWASQVRNANQKVVGVLALRTYSPFKPREHMSLNGLGLTVNLAAGGVSKVIGSDY
jgi:hypothetical protein